MKLYTFLLAVGTLTLSLDACRTVNSAAEGGPATAGGIQVPNITMRRVAPENIERLIPPASSLTGALSGMNGLWYCRKGACQLGLGNGTSIMTMANAQVMPDGASLRFGTYDPLNYAYNASVYPYNVIRDKQKAPVTELQYYTLTFSTETHADLFASFLRNGTLVPRDTSTYSFSMDRDPADQDHWVRKSSWMGTQLPNYDLLRIVDANGNRTAHYQDYLDDINSTKTARLVIVVATGSDLATSDVIIDKEGTIKSDVVGVNTKPVLNTDSGATSTGSTGDGSEGAAGATSDDNDQVKK